MEVGGGQAVQKLSVMMRGSGLTPASARVSGRSVIGINKSVRMILQRLTKSYRNDGKKYRGILTVLHNGSFLSVSLQVSSKSLDKYLMITGLGK
jgi:hypothetical protein